jgi:hypothetical protein
LWLVEHIILSPSLTSAILNHTRGKTDALKEFKSEFKKYNVPLQITINALIEPQIPLNTTEDLYY